MKAYAILDGGGVKGAALVGCLDAAADRGVKFIGYGGTSAGSIVALLSSVGYTPRELRQVIVDEGSFARFLDDDGRRLAALRAVGHRAREQLEAHVAGKRGPLARLRVLGELKKLAAEIAPEFAHLRRNFGVYRGQRFRAYLLEKIRAKLDVDDHANDITFADLHQRPLREHPERRAAPLKIVASDITRKKAVVCPDDTGDQMSVLDAVRASISYPLLFEPVRHGAALYVDGGICTNLPVFLFEEERLARRIPVIAMDLVNKPSDRESTEVEHVVSDLLTTAIDGSDRLLRDRIPNLHHVPVVIDPPVDTTDFNIGLQARKQLYSNGKDAYNHYHSRHFEAITRIGDRIERMRSVYGPPELFLPILDVVATTIELNSEARDVRAHIMLPTLTATLVVVYQHGMDDMSDKELEIPMSAWGAGEVFHNATPVLTDVQRLRADGHLGEQGHLVPVTVLSAVSFPILDTSRVLPMEDGATIQLDNLPVLGVLTVDSSTPLEDTGWLAEESARRKVPDELVRLIEEWANVLGRLLS